MIWTFIGLVSCVPLFHQADRTGADRTTLPWLRTEGNRIVDETGEIRILHGVNRSGMEYDSLGFGMSREEMAFICNDWNARIVRIPFNQEWMVQDSPYQVLLDSVIQWISDCGAYVVLDLQWESRKVRISRMPDETAAGMWRDLAGRYKHNSAVLYDLHNEPHDTTWEAWRQRAAECIEAIRSVHPKSLIFVGGLDWAYDLRGWQENPLPYKNIVYSSHPYPHKGEPWAWDKYFGDFSETHPVFAGEFGFGQRTLEWGTKLMAYLDEKQIGWAAWSWLDNPKLTQKDRRTPTVFGEKVREALTGLSPESGNSVPAAADKPE